MRTMSEITFLFLEMDKQRGIGREGIVTLRSGDITWDTPPTAKRVWEDNYSEQCKCVQSSIMNTWQLPGH